MQVSQGLAISKEPDFDIEVFYSFFFWPVWINNTTISEVFRKKDQKRSTKYEYRENPRSYSANSGIQPIEFDGIGTWVFAVDDYDPLDEIPDGQTASWISTPRIEPICTRPEGVLESFIICGSLIPATNLSHQNIVHYPKKLVRLFRL